MSKLLIILVIRSIYRIDRPISGGREGNRIRINDGITSGEAAAEAFNANQTTYAVTVTGGALEQA